MEIADYISMIKKNVVVFIVMIALFGGLTGYFTTISKPIYQTSIAIDIIRHQNQKQTDVDYFQYDNYYNTQAAGAISNNVAGWLSSASVVSEIFSSTGYERPIGNLRDIDKIFTAKKKVTDSSVIDISYSSDDSVKAEKLIRKVGEIVKAKVAEYNENDSSGTFEVFVSEPVVVETPKMTSLNVVIASIIGLFLAFSYASIKESLKK
jgi:capsular polysaccharide biosynthesis protein